MFAGHHKYKKQKTKHIQPILFLRMNTRAAGKPKCITLKGLLDTGASSTLIEEKHVKKLKWKKNKPTVWDTAAGVMETNKTAPVQLTLPELNEELLVQ